MPDSVIESFLIAIGYKIDRASAAAGDAALDKTRARADALQQEIGVVSRQAKELSQRFVGLAGTPTRKVEESADRIRRTHLRLNSEIKTLGLTATATTTAFVAGFDKIARKYSDLYYVAQRTGQSAAAVAQQRFVGPQIGFNTQTLENQIETLKTRLRDNPGLRNYFRNISGSNDAAQGLQNLAAAYRAILKLPNHETAESMLRSKIRLIADPDMMRQYALNLPAAIKAQAEFDERTRQAGIDWDKVSKDAVNVGRELTKVWQDWQLVAVQAFEAVQPVAMEVLHLVEGIDSEIIKLGKVHPAAAVAATAAPAAVGAYGATKLASGLARRVLGGAKAGAADVASAEEAAATRLAFKGFGLRPTPGFIIGEMIGSELHGHPDKYPEFQPGFMPHPLPEGQRWWDKTLRGLGTGAAAAGTVLSGLPSFQHGGIVAKVHPGEMVLPKAISDGLQTLIGSAASGMRSRVADYLTEWLRGSAGFRPYVQIDPSSLRDFFGGALGTGSASASGSSGWGGAAGIGFHTAGRRFGTMTVGGGLDQAFRAASKSGPQTETIASVARAAGASDAAITAMLAGALGEGGLSSTWKPGDRGTSFGPWQLHRGGELNRYLAEGNQPGDVAAQTRYVLKRLNEIHPGFSGMTNPLAATAVITRFERSVQGLPYYAANIVAAQRALSQTTTRPSALDAFGQARLGGDVHHHYGDHHVSAHQTNHFHLGVDGAVPAAMRRAMTGADDRLAATIVRNSRAVLN